jgi:uncharacterized membrane protein
MNERSLFPRMAAALLALLGLIDSAYLTIHHYRPSVSLSCPVGGGCETVQTSAWSTLPPGGNGVPVALIGVLGYAVLLGLALVSLQRDHVGAVAVPPLLLMVASGGLVFSFYLSFLQLFVIGAICFWCVMSALFELGIFIAALVDWRAWQQEQVEDPFDAPSFERGATQNR